MQRECPRMKRHEAVKLFFILLFLTVCFVSHPDLGAAQIQEVITLHYSHFFPAHHKHAVLAEEWCREIERQTGGRVQIITFYGEILTPVKDVYEATVKGDVDIGFGMFSYTKGRFPLTEVIDLPLGIKDGITATRLINAYYTKFRPKEMDDVKVLYLHAYGPAMLHTKKPVRRLEDLKGLKISGTGLAHKIIKALGAIPVGSEATIYETYGLLRSGQAEGAMAPFEALQGFKWGELVKYSTIANGSGHSKGMFVVMNKRAWNSLPPDIQKTITEVSEEWSEKQGRLWVEIEKEGIDVARKRGSQIIALSKEEDARWAGAVKPLLDEYVKATEAQGLPGGQALQFCLDYLKDQQN